MDSCLSDADLAVLVAGSGTSDQISTLLVHVASCDSCAARLARRQLAPDGEGASSDADATVSVRPPGSAGLDAGATAGPAADAIPGYRILKELHRGGQGVVYQAVQESAKRKVALKVMLEGPFAGAASKRRFEREIELVGSLRHPGIVPIFDSGVAAGRYYYAMEYIRGKPLAAHVQAKKLSIDDTLRLFGKVCEAVDYAHQRGVIHRDLKPSNILVDERGDPHVLDFGLAKIAGAEAAGDAASMLVSVTGQVMGTLQYMSPEQAAGRPDQVDMRSDVYSLGVVLYELLTGQFPYDVTGQMGTVLTTIQEAEPKSPRSLRRQIDDEVATIVLKALAKDKDRRYVTAGALGHDVTRYLAGDPIEAKRDSALYVLRKTLRRYKAPATVAAGFALLLVASTIVAWGLFARANTARETANTAREAADTAREAAVAAQQSERQAKEVLRRQAYFQQIGSAWGAWQSNDLTRFRRLLEDCDEDLRGWEWQHLHYRRQHSEHQARVFPEDQEGIRSLALSPDGKRIASGGYDGTIIVREVKTGDILSRTVAHEHDRVAGVAFSHDGMEMISGGGDKGGVKLWDVRTAQPRRKDEEWPRAAPTMGYRPAAFSSNGTKIVLVGEERNVIRVWDREKKEEKWSQIIGKKARIWWVAFSPDDQYVAAGMQGGVAVFDAKDGKRKWMDPGYRGECEAPGVFSPDGADIVSSTEDWVVRSWNVETGQPTGRFQGHTSVVFAVAFNPDGNQIVSGGGDRTVRLWDVKTGKAVRTFRGHEGPVTSVVFSSDGKTIFSAGQDGKIRAWAVDSREEPSVVLTSGNTESVAISPDGKWIAIGRNHSVQGGNGIRILDLATEGRVVTQPILGHVGPETTPAAVWSVAFSPDSRTLASCGRAWRSESDPMEARLWDVATGQKLADIPHEGAVYSVAFSPDGRWVATASGDKTKTVAIWDAARGQPVQTLDYGAPCRTAVFSPDGKTLAAGGDGGTVKFWDTATWQPHPDELDHRAEKVWSIAYSPDGEWIAAGGAMDRLQGQYKVWNARTLKSGPALSEVAGPARALAFTPDGSRIVGGSADGSVRLWDTRTGEEALVLPVLARTVTGVAFSPDGSQLVVTGADFTVKILHATSLEDDADFVGAPLAGMTLTPDDPDVLFTLRTAFVLADDMTTSQGQGKPLDHVEELIRRSRRQASAAGQPADDRFDALLRYVATPQQWMIVGPFAPKAGADPLEESFEPEETVGPIDPKTTYSRPSGEPLHWKQVEVGPADVTELNDGRGRKMRGTLGLLSLAPEATNVAAYALTYLHSETEQDVTLRIGSDGGAKMWFNEDPDPVYEHAEPRKLTRGEDAIRVTLRSGANRLLFKIAQRSGGWALVVEALDANGWPARVTWLASEN